LRIFTPETVEIAKLELDLSGLKVSSIMRILLVEDDELIVEPLVNALTDQRYVVDVARDGQAGWELVQACTYDLILLDVVLPRLDGISLCRRLRSHKTQTPILLLTAQDSSTHKVIGLDAGADDYLAKPFDWSELFARIRALLRRGGVALPPVLTWSQLQLDPSTCEVTYQQQLLHLTPKEYSLLELLLRNPHRTFSCSALIDHLWTFEEPPGDDTVRSHIKGLRHKLKVAGVHPDPVETVYGIGYRLKAEEKKPEAPAPGGEDAGRQLTAGMTDIWMQVQPVIQERITVIEQAAAAFKQGILKTPLRQQAVQAAHKLIGSMGLFGSEEGSRLAQELEHQLQTKPSSSSRSDSSPSSLVKALRQELQQIATDPGGKLTQTLNQQQASSPPAEVVGSIAIAEAEVLVVDDDPVIAFTLERMLTPWGLHVSTLTPSHLFEALEVKTPDLIVLDVELAHMSGIGLCQRIRERPQWSAVPIVFLTAHTDAATVHRVYMAGADDFVSKPIVEPELVTRILNRLERSRLLRHMAETDLLTGVINRWTSTQKLTQCLQQCVRQERNFCLAVVGVENLKIMNQQHGHAMGDRVLARVGEVLRSHFRHPTLVARWGGSEFVIGMMEQSKPEGEQRLADLQYPLQRLQLTDAKGIQQFVSVSIGIAAYPEDGLELERLYWSANDRRQPVVASPNRPLRLETLPRSMQM
jgi:diguanylate cyclase (GGDEF)-like protein